MIINELSSASKTDKPEARNNVQECKTTLPSTRADVNVTQKNVSPVREEKAADEKSEQVISDHTERKTIPQMPEHGRKRRHKSSTIHDRKRRKYSKQKSSTRTCCICGKSIIKRELDDGTKLIKKLKGLKRTKVRHRKMKRRQRTTTEEAPVTYKFQPSEDNINCTCNYKANEQCSLSSDQVTKDNYEDLIKFFVSFQKELDKQSKDSLLPHPPGSSQTPDLIEMDKTLEKFGHNFYKPSGKRKREGLRPIFIDGSNVAYGHGKDKVFSVRGLQICIDYFKRKGHDVKAFVPNFRLKKNQSTDPELLQKLVDKKLVIPTPTLTINNERRIPYDDWYIVQTAAIEDGVIVSRDSFGDIVKWKPSLRKIVEENRLVPTWVDDMIIFPIDPLGNRKNNLDEFLKY